jgi:hypothetical protein
MIASVSGGSTFMTQIDLLYDEFKLFYICLSAVSCLDCGLFFLSGLAWSWAARLFWLKEPL